MAGKAIIFSAPSGSGKLLLLNIFLQTNPDLGFSISASTRDKRGRTETHGKDYYFLSPKNLKKKLITMNSSNGKKCMKEISMAH